MSTLEFFHTLSKRDLLSEQETLIMAYGQAARYESPLIVSIEPLLMDHKVFVVKMNSP
jgi:hypothetical protein